MSEDKSRVRGSTRNIEQVARQLRQRATLAEEVLWDALRGRRLLGLKFRRQHPVGGFIVDFYCSSCRLAIEVDGEIHRQKEEYDAARTEKIRSYGDRVLRFTNADVLNNLQTVLARITQAAKGS